MNSPNPDVSKWWPVIREARELAGLTEQDYPDDLMLAFIDVESDGDAHAHRENSQFHGLLQMGRYAGIDAGLDDEGRDTTEELMGDGYAAICEFLDYQERYAARHHYQRNLCIVLWKAGPGTLSAVNRLTANGLALDDAIAQAADDLGVPNVMEYVRRMRAARKVWSEWLDGRELPGSVCMEGSE